MTLMMRQDGRGEVGSRQFEQRRVWRGVIARRRMMYLTRIDLRPQVRAIQRAMGDCQQMRRLVSGLFQSGRKESEILYRLRADRGMTAQYLYSTTPVDQSALTAGMAFAGERDLTDWLKELGQIWRGDLLTAPTKKWRRRDIKTAADGSCVKKQGDWNGPCTRRRNTDLICCRQTRRKAST